MKQEDEFGAVWVSYSSISDFLQCPRAYYLKNIYKNPQTGRKIQIISPSLALGQVIHQVLDEIARLPKEKRFEEPLLQRFQRAWQLVSGEKGGFFSEKEEKRYFARGQAMVERIVKNPGPLKRLAVRIKDDLPHFWLSKEDNLILCGKIDWLEYLPEEKGVHIIDFKTGRFSEDEDSLQLPVYYLLAQNCQSYSVAKMSYWYLDRDDEPQPVDLPNEEEAYKKILQVAKRIKLARQLEKFSCPRGEEGCPSCRPLARVVAGEGKRVGTNDFGQDVYILSKANAKEKGATETIL